jgi:uncharacterized MAPEG superfamily protein
VALLFVLILVQASASTLAHGPATMAGNRDDLGPPKPFEGRARRTLYNHIEAMALFAPLVLIVAVQEAWTPMTELGARLFFYGRVAHAGVYLIGIPYLRTLVWLVSMAGVALIFLSLFGLI